MQILKGVEVMKIKGVRFNNHTLFDHTEIKFETEEGKFLDTVVLAGINGSGKTTLLNNIYESIKKMESSDFIQDENSKVYLDIEISEEEKEKKPRVIYLPSEVRFKGFKSNGNRQEVSLAYCMDDKSTNDITAYIKDEFDKKIFSSHNLTVGQSIEKVCDEINSIFDILDLDVELVGMKDPSTKMPLFRNSSGAEFDINGLSSGEKQLFIRILSLKALDPVGALILVDEPEISLHPSWQQRIVEVYQHIGEGNQIIIATHSPHVISSVKKDSLKILSKNGKTVSVINGENLDETYGLPADIILLEIMGLNTVRHPYVQKLIDELKDMVRNDQYETEDFKNLYEEVTNNIGTIDQDILLINIEIARRKGGFDAQHKKD